MKNITTKYNSRITRPSFLELYQSQFSDSFYINLKELSFKFNFSNYFIYDSENAENYASAFSETISEQVIKEKRKIIDAIIECPLNEKYFLIQYLYSCASNKYKYKVRLPRPCLNIKLNIDEPLCVVDIRANELCNEKIETLFHNALEDISKFLLNTPNISFRGLAGKEVQSGCFDVAFSGDRIIITLHDNYTISNFKELASNSNVGFTKWSLSSTVVEMELMRDTGFFVNYDEKSFFRIVSALTGYSEQNLKRGTSTDDLSIKDLEKLKKHHDICADIYSKKILYKKRN